MSHLVALVVGVCLFLAVGFLQNSKPGNEVEDAGVAQVGGGDLSLESDLAYRLTIRLSEFLRGDPNAAKVLGGYASTPRENLCYSIVMGEIEGPEAALERFPAHESSGSGESDGADDADAQFWSDVDAFRRVYEFVNQGGTGSPVAAGILSEDEAAGLRERYGFYADVVLSMPLGPDEAGYERLRKPGAAFIGVGLIALMILGAIAAGFVLFIVAVVRLGMGRVRPAFVPPIKGGSVFLEVFTLFVGGFLLLKTGVGYLGLLLGWSDEQHVYVSLGLQWLLLLIPLWPLVRGMKWGEYHKAIGLHRGKGVLREIGAGVVGYLAGLPIFLGAVMLVFVLLAIKQGLAGGSEPPPSNPMVELVGSASPLMLAIFFVLGTVWAPLCEELVFRGALYRHLRGYLPSVLAALIGGVFFAFMHNYGAIMTPPLIALGFNFAMMREWRGSLIAPMTAHFLHNGTLLTLMILLFIAVGA